MWRPCLFQSASLIARRSGTVLPRAAAVAAARARTAPLLVRMSEADWTKAGRHTESGPYTAEDWLRIYAAHLEGHARQIEGNIAAWKATSSSR